MSTPVYHEARSRAGAEAYVRKTMDNLEAGAEQRLGYWIPVARLRPDQMFLRDRLEERGILCVPVAGERVVSAAMIGAGAEVLKRRVQPECGDGFALEVAREVYEAMEALR